MRDDDFLDQLPEAVPLYRVAPWWRLLAVFAIIGMVVLFVVALILGIAVVQMDHLNVAVNAPVPPSATPVFPPAVAAGGPGVDSDAEADPQNLPYPVTADVAEDEPYESADERSATKGSPTARQRFLQLGTDLWKLKEPLPEQLAISPDGERMAYVVNGKLTAGPIGAQRQIVTTVIRSVPVQAMPGGRPVYGYAASVAQFAEIQLRGPLSWSPDNPYVYCADGNGHLRRYDLGSAGISGEANSQVLPFEGDSPAPVPTEPEKLVFVRGQPRPKIEVPGTHPALDQSEVVLGDLSTRQVRVLVPASASNWRHLAVSPDGKRLALVSDRGHEGKRSQHLRIFVLDLAGGEPKPLTPPASQAGPVCWTADSQALIYARSQEPVPADHWEDEPNGPNASLDLYQWDFTTNRETCLSRGGGYFSPCLSVNDDLHYLAAQDAGSAALLLRHLPLAAVREFAAREPQSIPRDAEAWTQLFRRVLEDCQLSANLGETVLTSEITAKLADTFNKRYRERFQAEPPSTLRALDRQRRELEQLNLSTAVYPALTLVLGALEGEYLVRRHGARWRLSGGPPLPVEPASPVSTTENPFGYVVNPFASVAAWARQTGPATSAESLAALLRRVDGRTLVLANETSAGQAALAGLTEPDLARGRELLEHGRAEEAEEVFEKMLKLTGHEKNLYLNLQVGNLLYENKRYAAVQRLMEHQCDLKPHDARKFNLLGLSLLNTQPQQAINAFKSALRCDLRFGAGYLNLAEAYQRVNELASARLCLRRYLALMPDGVYAADARRRLGAVSTNDN